MNEKYFIFWYQHFNSLMRIYYFKLIQSDSIFYLFGFKFCNPSYLLEYTPHFVYKSYHVLAKLLPSKVIMMFSKV